MVEKFAGKLPESDFSPVLFFGFICKGWQMIPQDERTILRKQSRFPRLRWTEPTSYEGLKEFAVKSAIFGNDPMPDSHRRHYHTIYGTKNYMDVVDLSGRGWTDLLRNG